MSDLSFAPGKFVWHELMTADAEAAKAFYGPLFGWAFEASGAPMEAGKTYTIGRPANATEPERSTLPWNGIPARARSNVVSPAPRGPTTTVGVPATTSRSRSERSVV